MPGLLTTEEIAPGFLAAEPPRNGLAACPSHDVAFDTGMLTVTADLSVTTARSA